MRKNKHYNIKDLKRIREVYLMNKGVKADPKPLVTYLIYAFFERVLS